MFFYRKVLPLFILCLTFFESSAQTLYDQSNFDVKFYGLDVQLNDTSTFISGNTSLLAELLAISDTLTLNLGQQLTVAEIEVNNNAVGFSHSNEYLRIPIKGIPVGQTVSIVIWYSGDGNSADNFGALFNLENSYGQFTYSLTEPFASKYWYPCKEVLSDKADSVNIFITVPKGQRAGSNGLLQRIKVVDEEHLQFQWKTNYATAFYLISAAVGDYYDYTFNVSLPGKEENMPFVNYIYNSSEYLKENKEKIDQTAEMLTLFSNKFGLYPFHMEKYGHSLIPTGGGMEHQTMTSLGNFNFNLVAHELLHQWFGDLVTCTYWNDIWINEGFASYGEYIALEEIRKNGSEKGWMENAHEIVKELPSGSVYVPEIEIGISSRIFDYRLSYKKGASIIHMLRYEVNDDELFYKILREFLKRHSFGNATGEDLKLIFEEFTARKFDDFFNEWYYGEGYPILDISWFHLNDTVYVINKQSVSAPGTTDFFHLNLQYKFITPMGDTLVTHKIVHQNDTFKMYMPSKVYDISIDPFNYLILKVDKLKKIDTGDYSLNKILLFPNPAGEEVSLFSRTINLPVDITFYNIAGEKVKYFENIAPYGETLPIGELEDGVYLVDLHTGDQSVILHLIKK